MALKFTLTDDDSDDRELFVEALAEVDQSVECVTFSNGRDTVKLLSDPSFTKPDLIFLDINLAEMSGWDCLKQLKNKDLVSDIPVVMYSTSSHERDVQFTKDLGAVGLITKPADFTQLKLMLGKIVAAVGTSAEAGLSAAVKELRTK